MLKIAWSSIYSHPLPPGHRFPMDKYTLLPEQLLYEGTVTDENFFAPPPLEAQYITNTHTPDYWRRLSTLQLTPREVRRTGFPLSAGLVHREIVIANGTVLAAHFALEHGVAMNIAGGTHHAFTGHGEGFCLLNDMAIAANYLLDKGLVRKVLVVDLDVHQGNGTHAVFAGDPTVFTFSMHGAKNFPFHKVPGSLDVELADGTGDDYGPRLLAAPPRLIAAAAPALVVALPGWPPP